MHHFQINQSFYYKQLVCFVEEIMAKSLRTRVGSMSGISRNFWYIWCTFSYLTRPSSKSACAKYNNIFFDSNVLVALSNIVPASSLKFLAALTSPFSVNIFELNSRKCAAWCQTAGWCPRQSKHCSIANITRRATKDVSSVRRGLLRSQAIYFFHNST